jgi:hypothetical protein
MIMAMDIMVIPIATLITITVIPVEITMVTGMGPVIGDETKGQGGKGQPESH